MFKSPNGVLNDIIVSNFLMTANGVTRTFVEGGKPGLLKTKRTWDDVLSLIFTHLTNQWDEDSNF